MSSRLIPSGPEQPASRASTSTSSRWAGSVVELMMYVPIAPGHCCSRMAAVVRNVWHDLVGLGRERQPDRDQRPPLPARRQAAEPFVLGRQLRVVGRDAGGAEDLVEAPGVAARVLPQVDRQHVDAEDLDQPDHVLDLAPTRRGGTGAGLAEVIGDELQVVVQVVGARDKSPRAGGVSSWLHSRIGGSATARACCSKPGR